MAATRGVLAFVSEVDERDLHGMVHHHPVQARRSTSEGDRAGAQHCCAHRATVVWTREMACVKPLASPRREHGRMDKDKATGRLKAEPTGRANGLT